MSFSVFSIFQQGKSMKNKLSLQEFEAYVLNETSIKDKKYWDRIHFLNRTENYPYHSLVKDDFENQTNEMIFERCLHKFCEILYLNYSNDGVRLFRALALHDLSELKFPLGVYWSYLECEAHVYDDCDYPHDKNINRDHYIVQSDVSLNDIDWALTFELYLMLDFAESEVRLKHNASITNAVIKLKNNDNAVPLKLVG